MADEKNLVNALLGALSKKGEDEAKGKFNERAFAERLQKRIPHIKVVRDDWHAYEEGAWVPVTREQFLPVALSTCPKKHQKARNAQNLLDHLEARFQARSADMAGFYKLETLDTGEQNILINAANGVVRVWYTGEITLEKHSEEHAFTSRAAAHYNPKASCPLFTSLQEEALPDVDDRELFQIFCGNILYPSAQCEAALISYGPGGSGKSTLAFAVAHALAGACRDGGPVTSLSMTQICDSRSYSLPKLQRSALNLGTELDALDLDESSNFKQIVSGENVETRGIYAKPVAMNTTCKLWFIANTLPRFKNGTGAELRRLRFLQFEKLPKKEDTSLKFRLQAERDGIFLWMIEGLIKLLQTNIVPQGGVKSRAIAEKFAVSNDPVGFFIGRKCVLEGEARIQKSTLQKEFEAFLNEHGLPDHFADWFFRRLYERFPDVKALRDRGTDLEEIHWVKGIRLRRESDGLL